MHASFSVFGTLPPLQAVQVLLPPDEAQVLQLGLLHYNLQEEQEESLKRTGCDILRVNNTQVLLPPDEAHVLQLGLASLQSIRRTRQYFCDLIGVFTTHTAIFYNLRRPNQEFDHERDEYPDK